MSETTNDAGCFVFGYNDEFFGSDHYPTREAAVEAAHKEDPEEPYIWTGVPLPFSPVVDPWSVLDSAEQAAYDHAGEAGDAWRPSHLLRDIEKRRELEDALTAALTAWLAKHGETPTFFGVEDIQRHVAKLPEVSRV